MTNEEFLELVKRAEQEIERHPRGYRTKVFLFGLLGYLVVFTVLVILLTLVGGSLAAGLFSSALLLLLFKSKLIFPFAAMAWVLLKSLWVRFEKPTGFVLGRNKYPALFAEIDGLRKKLDALPVHQVILVPQANAAVVQTPRLGVLGWQYNTLFLGLELLMILSVEQARAVIAHELGHLSQNHSRFAGWIYRVRITWDRIMHAFDRRSGFGIAWIRKFFDWYAPRFSAYSFALARNNEYEADAISAALTSKAAAAQALINTHVVARYVNENYWRSFFKRADDTPAPEEMPWSGFSRFVAANLKTSGDLESSLKEQLRVESDYMDTHPSLSDRLKAIGCGEPLAYGIERNAAQVWLGECFRAVIDHFDKTWVGEYGEKWRQRFNYVVEAKEKLKGYREAELSELGDEDLWQLANLTYEFKSAEAALPLYQVLRSRSPQHAGAAYAVGMILFERKDEGCLALFEIAVRDPRYTMDGCRYAYAFLEQSGRGTEARRWAERAGRRAEEEREAEEERSSVTVADNLAPPQMKPEVREQLIRQLKATGLVSSAWLAQKVVSHYPERPVYIVAFKAPLSKSLMRRKQIMKRVGQAISVPHLIFVVVYGGDYKKLARNVMSLQRKIV